MSTTPTPEPRDFCGGCRALRNVSELERFEGGSRFCAPCLSEVAAEAAEFATAFGSGSAS